MRDNNDPDVIECYKGNAVVGSSGSETTKPSIIDEDSPQKKTGSWQEVCKGPSKEFLTQTVTNRKRSRVIEKKVKTIRMTAENLMTDSSEFWGYFGGQHTYLSPTVGFDDVEEFSECLAIMVDDYDTFTTTMTKLLSKYKRYKILLEKINMPDAPSPQTIATPPCCRDGET